MVDINKNNFAEMKYIIKLFTSNTKIVTKDCLKPRNLLDIEYITISSEDIVNESNNIAQYHIKNSIFPEVHSPLQQKFKYWHDTLLTYSQNRYFA